MAVPRVNLGVVVAVANIELTVGKDSQTYQEEIPSIGAIADEGQDRMILARPVLDQHVSVYKRVKDLVRLWRAEGIASLVAAGESLGMGLSEPEVFDGDHPLALLRHQAELMNEIVSGLDPLSTDDEFFDAVVSGGAARLVNDHGKPRLVLRGGAKKKGKALRDLSRAGKGFGREVEKAVVKAAVSRLTGSGGYGLKGIGKALKSAATREMDAQRSRAIARIEKGIQGSGFYRGEGEYRGRGSYEHKYNQLFPSQTSDVAMHIAGANNETGNIIIRKREYLFDVFSPNTPANFTTNRFQANPGLGGLGLFVSQIASNYEKYRYKQLVFTYKPTVTDSSSTGQMGSVLMAFNSNAGAADFVTKQQMAEYDGSMSVRVCDAATLGVECDPRKGADSWNFVRVGNVPAGQDIKTYDYGTFTIATAGLSSAVFPAGTSLGEVWVDYTVELAGPKLYDGMGYSNLVDVFYGTGPTAAYPVGVTCYKSSLNSLGGRLTLTSDTRYTFPDNFQGWVRINAYMAGSTASNFFFTPTGQISSFVTMLDSALLPVSTIASNSVSGTYTLRVNTYYVQFAKTAGGNYITLTGTVSGGTVGWFIVEQCNSLPGAMTGVSTTFVPN